MSKCKKCPETNPENFYKSNKHVCKKCCSQVGINKYKNFTDEQRKAYIQYNKDWQRDNLFQYRLLSARSRAKKKGIEVKLSVKFLKQLFEDQKGLCYYSGLPMEMTKVSRYSMSIDRMDSTKGYTEDNIVLVASIVNTMKNDLPIKDFIDVVNSIAMRYTTS